MNSTIKCEKMAKMAHHWLKMAFFQNHFICFPRAIKRAFRKYIILICDYNSSRIISETIFVILYEYIYESIGHTFLNLAIFECPWTANYTTYRLQILHTYSGGSREEVCVISWQSVHWEGSNQYPEIGIFSDFFIFVFYVRCCKRVWVLCSYCL